MFVAFAELYIKEDIDISSLMIKRCGTEQNQIHLKETVMFPS